ncbi:MAG: hypothetical protein HQ498_07770, partial [Pseudohongiella sp.]|nr:hypothetical protein [Pseudohongiella sp.]
MKNLHLLNQAHQSKFQLSAGETGSILTGFICALPSIIFSFSLGFPVAALADTCVPATPDGAGLQACLDSAFDGDTILLPAGTYAPVVERVPGDPRSVTFDLFKSVILESYAGAILSGDLNGDDDGAGGNTGDNAKNVIRSTSGSTLQITLRGLTVRGGNGSVGAGILIANNNTSLTMDDVDFSGNRASAWGGGLYMRGSTLNIHNSSFTNNAAGITGGGINIVAPTMVSIENSTFSENHARVVGGINIASSLGSFSDVSITASSF